MTTDQFIKKMDDKIALILKEDKPLFLGVKGVMSLQSKRIWIDGKNKNGSNIGEYKGGEIYVSPKSVIKGATRTLPSFPLKGKTGKDTFENGNKHKTGYFQNWVGFKKKIGRQKGKTSVDLFLTGTLASDWANAELTKDAKATKVNQHNYYVSLTQLSLDKADRYNGSDNKVFGLSIIEKGKFLNIVQQELAKGLR